MGDSSIRIEGIEDVRRLIKKGNQIVLHAARVAVSDATGEVADKADNLAPEDSTDLRSSQTINWPSHTSDDPTGEIAYGGPSAPYAVVQHENLDLWHPPKPPGNKDGHVGDGPTSPGTAGSPKYLEFPLMEMRKTFDDKIVATIKKLLR
jgi:hypothetical protein